MSPRIVVDTSAATPPYEQIRAQIAGLVASGEFQRGQRLPTVRALAADLGIAANTVARSYKELEAVGVLTTRRRAGTTVADGVASAHLAVARQADVFARAAMTSGLDEATALDLVRSALRRLARPPADD
jgi:DNA-binding transcriptional regulator YhcF (GntR family)